MKTEDKIQQVIDLSEQKTSLLKELKESVIYEQKSYDLIKFNIGFENTYLLIRISDKIEVSSGGINIIKSFIKIRNIDIDTIYNNKCLIN
jgi:hypothetical protein